MKQVEIYRETIDNFWSIVQLVFLLLAIVFLAIGVFQSGTVNVLFLTMFGIAVLLGLLSVNFLMLRVSVSDSGIKVSFGLIHRFTRWENIKGYEIDPVLLWTFFGAYGMRTSIRSGQPMQSFAVSGQKVFVLRLKEGWYKYFGFSTRHPEELKALVESKMR